MARNAGGRPLLLPTAMMTGSRGRRYIGGKVETDLFFGVFLLGIAAGLWRDHISRARHDRAKRAEECECRLGCLTPDAA